MIDEEKNTTCVIGKLKIFIKKERKKSTATTLWKKNNIIMQDNIVLKKFK